MPAQIIQMMAFTQIMVIWTPGITLQDHTLTTKKALSFKSKKFNTLYIRA